MELCSPSSCCSRYYRKVIIRINILRSYFCRLENTRSVVEWINDNLPEEDELTVKVQYGDVAELNNIFVSECLKTLCDESTTFSSSLEATLY
jgi:hypothetical protein